jgi:hypothetical protein
LIFVPSTGNVAYLLASFRPVLEGYETAIAGHDINPKCHDSVKHMRLIVISPWKKSETLSNLVQRSSVLK